MLIPALSLVVAASCRENEITEEDATVHPGLRHGDVVDSRCSRRRLSLPARSVIGIAARCAAWISLVLEMLRAALARAHMTSIPSRADPADEALTEASRATARASFASASISPTRGSEVRNYLPAACAAHCRRPKMTRAAAAVSPRWSCRAIFDAHEGSRRGCRRDEHEGSRRGGRKPAAGRAEDSDSASDECARGARRGCCRHSLAAWMRQRWPRTVDSLTGATRAARRPAFCGSPLFSQPNTRLCQRMRCT